ncbi:DUF1415 domain-containing protein [Dokdonella sp.]|uniref:DUF1415 domain-containing protein n=1 Tax=Dokdonella sp. TaxID=2291710 RepID=UPI002F3F1C3C
MSDLHADVKDAPTDDAAIAATRRWIERAVIGLNLCPFARAPFTQDRLRITVSRATDIDALVDDLRKELEWLRDADAHEWETSLLVHPFVLGDFEDYNQFLDVADALLEAMELDGEIQLASFHPQYRFADAGADDIGNATNRSPFPTLHLLRESSIDRAVESGVDTDAIYERNIETLRKLGHHGWEALWVDGEDDVGGR